MIACKVDIQLNMDCEQQHTHDICDPKTARPRVRLSHIWFLPTPEEDQYNIIEHKSQKQRCYSFRLYTKQKHFTVLSIPHGLWKVTRKSINTEVKQAVKLPSQGSFHMSSHFQSERWQMGTADLPGVPCSLLQAAHGNRDSSGFVPTEKEHPDRHLKTQQECPTPGLQYTALHSLYCHMIYIVLYSCTEKKKIMWENHKLCSGFCVIHIRFYKQELW